MNEPTAAAKKVDIWSLLNTKDDFFFALKSAIKQSLSKTIEDLLKRSDPFGHRNAEVDLFILLVIPKLKFEDPRDIISIFFGSNLRNRTGAFEFEFKSVGTISYEALHAYVLHLWSHPAEIQTIYPLYRSHLNNPLVSENHPSHSKFIKVYEMLLGTDDHQPPQSSDLLTFPEIFDENGILHYDVFWMLGNFPKWIAVVTRDMVSSLTFKRVLELRSYIDKKVLERLFGVFDVKKEFRTLLRSRKDDDDLTMITEFASTFRIESDFELVSKLPFEEEIKRHIEIKYERIEKYLYAIVFESKPARNGILSSKEFLLKPAAKIVLSIDQNIL